MLDDFSPCCHRLCAPLSSSATRPWHDAAVFERLRARGLALCVADSERLTTPVEITADYAYFWLRDEGYQPADIIRWAETIAASMAACREVFVYLKHEDQARDPSSPGGSSRRCRHQPVPDP